jgi:hypothetical protein
MVNADGASGTRLETTLTATGQDVSGGSSDRIPCGSTGRLEQLISDAAKGAVIKP